MHAATLPYIHISTAKHLLAQPDPVSLVVWKRDGSLVTYVKQSASDGTLR